MPMFTDCASDRGPFSIINTDCGGHNILLDSNCNVVGLIDCDNIIAGPIHLVVQPPMIAGLVIHPPGLVTRKPLAIPVWEEQRVRWQQYLEIFKAAE